MFYCFHFSAPSIIYIKNNLSSHIAQDWGLFAPAAMVNRVIWAPLMTLWFKKFHFLPWTPPLATFSTLETQWNEKTAAQPRYWQHCWWSHLVIPAVHLHLQKPPGQSSRTLRFPVKRAAWRLAGSRDAHCIMETRTGCKTCSAVLVLKWKKPNNQKSLNLFSVLPPEETNVVTGLKTGLRLRFKTTFKVEHATRLTHSDRLS